MWIKTSRSTCTTEMWGSGPMCHTLHVWKGTHWKLLGVPMSALVSLFFFPPLFFFSLLGKEECTMLFI